MKRWDGVADGTRTHDDQNHNLGLYQLSYSHRRANEYSPLAWAIKLYFVSVPVAAAATGATPLPLNSTLKRLRSALM